MTSYLKRDIVMCDGAEHEPLEQRGEAADGAGERDAGPRGAAGGVRRRAAARAAARARQRHQGEEHLCPRQLGARPARRAAPAARRPLPPGTRRKQPSRLYHRVM